MMRLSAMNMLMEPSAMMKIQTLYRSVSKHGKFAPVPSVLQFGFFYPMLSIKAFDEEK
jgi:hypothetical protein